MHKRAKFPAGNSDKKLEVLAIEDRGVLIDITFSPSSTISPLAPSPKLALRLKALLQTKSGIAIIVVAWALSILTGVAIMGREALTPITPVTATTFAREFPNGSAIPLATDKPTIIVFAHPQCPCTRATFHQLASVMQQTQNRASLVIVFTLPPGVPADWEKGDLYQLAQTLPARIVLDRGGIEAQRLHIVGSGTTLLYSAGRQLLFGGGITSSRGHDGDSVGSVALTSLLLHGTATVASAPVFGCSLL